MLNLKQPIKLFEIQKTNLIFRYLWNGEEKKETPRRIKISLTFIANVFIASHHINKSHNMDIPLDGLFT